MSVEADLYGILVGSTSVAALSSQRIYPTLLPQNTVYPAISYLRISSERYPLMGGDAVNVASRFQVDCWDDDALGSRTLANTVRQALQRYGSSTGTVTIDTIFIDQQQEIPERDLDEDIYRVSFDFLIHYRE